jgi:hypothetical protein
MILPALALAIKNLGHTTVLVMLTYGGGKVQDVSPIIAFQSGAECIIAMHEFHEIHEKEIEDGLYTFQCDQSNEGVK